MPKSNTIPAAVVFGCAGLSLTRAEQDLFAAVNPLGLILFARNIDTPEQVRTLVRAFRSCVGRDDAPVLIDQEGGRVQRLRPPHWRAAPTGQIFAALAERDRSAAEEALYLNFRLIGQELADLGIDVDCAPVLDIPVTGAHDVIGDRAYGQTAEQVAALGRCVMNGLLDSGVLPIVKHIPGHGRAAVDSHQGLPVVNAPYAALEEQDFLPFQALADAPWGMTAHIVYSAIDALPATISPKIIDTVIRDRIGFQGVLASDDISSNMKALPGTYAERAVASLRAGCDLVLHCDGDFEGMQQVAAVVPSLSQEACARLERANKARRCCPPLYVAATLKRLDALLA